MLHEIQLIPFGSHATSRGNFLLDEEALKLVVSTFDAQANDLVVDYEHQTLSGKEAPAAGWIKKLINRGAQGLWGVVEWTERAKAFLAAKEYRYLSPVFMRRNGDSRVVRLHSAALTNTPEIDGMVPLVNKADCAILACSFKFHPHQPFIDETERQIMDQLRLSDEVFSKYSEDVTLALRETEAESARWCSFKAGNPLEDEIQRQAEEQVRQQTGISDEIWRKYGG